MSEQMFKDPNAVLDYGFNWSGWLNGDTISTHEIIAPEGITVDSSATDGSSVTTWVSGGTAGSTYRLVCRINTAGGRKEDRSLHLIVTDR